MVSSEVQRTLVKSPPELWAELSDPEALARHLSGLGEIRITRTQPEEQVDWEADGTSGTVLIKASGWGTKVTLSVTREVAEQAPEVEETASTESGLSNDDEASVESVWAAEVVSSVEEDFEEQPEPSTVVEPQPEPRRGFFARLFGRRRRAEPLETSELAPDAFAAVREVLATETFLAKHPFAALPEITQTPEAPTEGPAKQPDAEAAPVGDLSAELLAAEEAATEEVAAVLTSVLDRLGAAHHRPFSRA